MCVCVCVRVRERERLWGKAFVVVYFCLQKKCVCLYFFSVRSVLSLRRTA